MRISDWSSDVCSSDLLEEIIDNSCAQYFLFALYAIIPVQELIDIDLKKPMTFSSAAVASYNPFSGTFHEVRVNRPITVTPKDGELRSGSEGISPDEIRSEEHTSELQSLIRTSYSVFCLKKKQITITMPSHYTHLHR